MRKNPHLTPHKNPHVFSKQPPRNPVPSNQHTLNAVMTAQITGKSFKSIRHLGTGFFSHMNSSFNSLASLVVELEDSVTRQDGSKCKSCLLSISKRLSEVTSSFYQENRDWFIMLHGPEILVRILEFPPPSFPRTASHPPPARTRVISPQKRPRSPVPPNQEPSPSSSSSSYSPYYPNRPDAHADQYAWKTRNQCMAILRELCFTHPQVGEWLGANDRFIVFLFSLLADAKTFDAAIGLIEEVLGAKEDTFDLSRVPNFNALVRGMSKGQLGFFCRVLAMVVFEPDDRNGDEIVSSLELLRSRKKGRIVTPAVRNIDRNHAIVLGIPGLLERLVKLLRGSNQPDSQHHLPHFPSVTDLLAIHYYQQRGGALDGDDMLPGVTMGGGAAEGALAGLGLGGVGLGLGGVGLGPGGLGGAGGDDRDGDGLGGMMTMMMGGGEDGDVRNVLHTVEQELEALMDGTAQTLKALALSTYQVELLFVLYALLAGKRKAELQDRLASMGLIQTATALFDNTDWLKPPTPLQPHERAAIHGPQCECNPDAALKIQLLRLILNFCDGDFENRHNKRLLLSPEELASLYGNEKEKEDFENRYHPYYTYNNDDSNNNNNNNSFNNHTSNNHNKYNNNNNNNSTHNHNKYSNNNNSSSNSSYNTSSSNHKPYNGAGPSRAPSKDTQGLLSKLISVFYKLPQEQNNRFWMASCIEAFLRGSEPIFQKFVARSGMLEYLIDDIVAEGPKTQGSMQTSFDLLGELMKFNREIFASFNRLVVGDKLTKFLGNVITHLVDSNVFLRGMVLSMERFTEEDKAKSGTPGHTPYPFSQCKIAQFLEQNWYRLVKDLMTVVSIDDINQENICCVNTTMVFCIHAKRKGQLRSFIQKVREEEATYRTNGKTLPAHVTTNFQKLLWFWHEYYLLRGKDCLSLEYTSQIPFQEWTRTYEVLVEELGEFDPQSLYEAWREREQQHKNKSESKHAASSC